MTRNPNSFSTTGLMTSLLFIIASALPASAQELNRITSGRPPATLANNSETGATGRVARRSRPERGGPMKIRAREGDTISSLATRFNVPADAVAQLNSLSPTARLHARQEVLVPSVSPRGYRAGALVSDEAPPESPATHEGRKRLSLTDGSVIEADDVWESEQGVRYRRGGITFLIERDRLRSIDDSAAPNETTVSAPTVRLLENGPGGNGSAARPVWIYLAGGARVEADEVTETATGAWYRRGNLSIFVERSRIERIEREPAEAPSTVEASRTWTERGWSTGNVRIDQLVRENGARFGVDPYLIFCVMEQESHFQTRVVSPKGARGLMQLMPGTGARFGVRNPFDPAQNIMGGARYLKQLLEQFGGRVDLVLAGYNAGEGAVMKFGRNVPPYRETRDYVRKISARYRQGRPVAEGSNPLTVASRLR